MSHRSGSPLGYARAPANSLQRRGQEIMNRLKLLLALFVLAATLDLLLGEGDRSFPLVQACLDALRQLGLW